MRSPLHLGVALVAMAALTGCGAGGRLAPQVSSDAAEETAVSVALSESPDVVEEGLVEALDETSLGDFGGDRPAATSVEELIHPLRYWRNIRSVERRFEFAFSDTDSTGRPTRALVVIHKRLLGTFNILAGDSLPDPGEPRDSSLVLIHKRLADHSVRRVALVRVRPHADGDRRRGWRIVAASGVEITSTIPDARPTRILSLRIRSEGLDTTVTDPLVLRRLPHVLKFEPDAEVGLTVTTERPDDVVTLLSRDRRFRLHPNGDNTYSGRWRAPFRLGFHHLGVNALAHGTLFDDQAPYSSQAWVLHYVVRGGEPVAALEP